ncbi:hypothetical protein [Halosegnis longus]|uniref:hypothetical protein n=1 Tax=Halosegnis longus TaxID=2216012 RepID=UPI00096A9E8F|nr:MULTISPECIES: hypothetical protein [Halobacteriales]
MGPSLAADLRDLAHSTGLFVVGEMLLLLLFYLLVFRAPRVLMQEFGDSWLLLISPVVLLCLVVALFSVLPDEIAGLYVILIPVLSVLLVINLGLDAIAGDSGSAVIEGVLFVLSALLLLVVLLGGWIVTSSTLYWILKRYPGWYGTTLQRPILWTLPPLIVCLSVPVLVYWGVVSGIQTIAAIVWIGSAATLAARSHVYLSRVGFKNSGIMFLLAGSIPLGASVTLTLSAITKPLFGQRFVMLFDQVAAPIDLIMLPVRPNEMGILLLTQPSFACVSLLAVGAISSLASDRNPSNTPATDLDSTTSRPRSPPRPNQDTSSTGTTSTDTGSSPQQADSGSASTDDASETGGVQWESRLTPDYEMWVEYATADSNGTQQLLVAFPESQQTEEELKEAAAEWAFYHPDQSTAVFDDPVRRECWYATDGAIARRDIDRVFRVRPLNLRGPETSAVDGADSSADSGNTKIYDPDTDGDQDKS